MHNQRSYRTNLDYEATVNREDFSEKCKSFNPGSKGQTTLRLKEFSTIRIQITSRGYVKFHGGTVDDDVAILRILTPFVTTTDSKVFSWELNKRTLGDKQLLRWTEVQTMRLDYAADRVKDAEELLRLFSLGKINSYSRQIRDDDGRPTDMICHWQKVARRPLRGRAPRADLAALKLVDSFCYVIEVRRANPDSS